MHESAPRSSDYHRQIIGDVVVHVEKLRFKIIAEFNLVAVLYDMEIKFREMRELYMPFFHESFGQLGGIDIGMAKLVLQVRYGADMVKMAMRQYQAADVLLSLLEVFGIGNDEVYAGHIVLREHNAGVNYDNRSEERRVGKECRSRWSP